MGKANHFRNNSVYDNSRGHKLIEELKNDPVRFLESGRAHLLADECSCGFPIENLKPLFYMEDNNIKRTAVLIASELNYKSECLLKDVLTLIYDEDTFISWYAIETVMLCASGDDFLHIFYCLEHPNETIRRDIMQLIPEWRDFDFRIREAYEYLQKQEDHSVLHEKGLSCLVRAKDLTDREIIDMLNCDEPVIRKYGMIAAVRVHGKYSQIIKDQINNFDPEISEYAAYQVHEEKRILKKKRKGKI